MNRDIGIVDRAIQRHKDKVAAELIRREENLRRALLETEALARQVKADQQKEKYRIDPSYRERKIATSNQWRKDNRDRYLELMANWRDANRAKVRHNSRESMRKRRELERQKYGMSLYMYNKLNKK